MSELRPKKTVQKILISTTSRFIGEYEADGMLIAHASSGFAGTPNLPTTLTENPLCRNSFIISFETPPMEKDPLALPDYSVVGDRWCTYLSILFGKRFDNHGLVEGIGFFRLPQFEHYSTLCNPRLPQNNHSPRKDLEIELDLKLVSLVERLIVNRNLEPQFVQFLRSAGRFYLQALQTFERQPETAYLNLITCGEILSNYYNDEYEKEDLLDDETKSLLGGIEKCCQDGPKIAKQVRGRLMQVKRRFVKTVLKLLNDYFFTHSESTEPLWCLRKENMELRIAAAYDLRSCYVHSGIDFGVWVSLWANHGLEVQLGTPNIEDQRFQKSLTDAPTFLGLERIMRFCLLRFMHLNGVEIDARLADTQPEQPNPGDVSRPTSEP